MFEEYELFLENLKQNSHFRAVKDINYKDEKFIYVDGRKLLNLSSNNYLNFADNEKITNEFLNTEGAKYSFGSASARLLTGTLPIYKQLEKLISYLFNTEKTLLFNSGYHANVGINSSLAGKNDVIFADKLNHASIIDGMQLAKGKFFRYQHNNMESLERLLKRERTNYQNAFIVTESVFSMDGDIAQLKEIVELKNKYNCALIVDEAHAFGVFGKKGLGVAEQLDLIDEIDLIMGTFGKSIGSMGAFATGKKVLIDYLTNCARSFIFSTSLPPINIGFSKWIIEEKLPYTYEKRMKMLEIGQKLGSESQIIPFIVGENDKTLELSEILFKNGYFTLPVRPPTVPAGTSRLRLSLTADICLDDLTKLQEILNKMHPNKA